MEKRFFLAIMLSFCAVMVWSSLTPKTTNTTNSSFFEQNTSNKPVSSQIKTVDIVDSMGNDYLDPETTRKQSFESVNTTLVSDNITVEFTSKGGNIDKITINEFASLMPVKNIMDIAEYQDGEFMLISAQNDTVIYELTDNDVVITKKYKLPKGTYLIEAEIEYKNQSKMSKKTPATFSTYLLDMSILDNNDVKNFQTEKGLYEYSFLSGQKVRRKGNAVSFSEKNNASYEEKPEWIGFRNRYNCLLVHPLFDVSGHKFQYVDDKRLRSRFNTETFSLLPQEVKKFQSITYVGPQRKVFLQDTGYNFDKILAFFSFGLLNGIALFIHYLLIMINKVIPNWGLCIIITSTLIYLSMYPLTMRGMLSMKRMQSMQPKIAELKEKHRDNPQKMNKEMMELYKKHKINPLGGCLPFLFQMPIFIGLYQVLWRSVELKGAGFLWIQDLSQPDRLFTFSQKLPLIGNEFNILPFFMMIIMFFQQRLSAKNMNVTDPAQKTQQKIMGIFFPIFLGVLFYKFASGLTLYFTVFYLFSTYTQLKMSKKVEVLT